MKGARHSELQRERPFPAEYGDSGASRGVIVSGRVYYPGCEQIRATSAMIIVIGFRQREWLKSLNVATKVFWYLILLLTAVFSLSSESIACIFVSSATSVCQAHRSAGIVFQGTVLDLSRIQVSDASQPGSTPHEVISVLLAVEKVWKGTDQKQFRVITSTDCCAFSFQLGERYIVYARQDSLSNVFRVGSRTSGLEKAKNDLAYLNRLEKHQPVGSIYGIFKEIGHDVASGTEIRVEGNGRHGSVRPDNEGRFKLVGLSGGKYQVRVDFPERFDPDPYEIEVRLEDSQDCFELIAWPRPAGHVDGVLKDKTGKPLVGIAVVATREKSVSSSTSTDQNGRFVVKHLDPGSYVIKAALRDDWGEMKAEAELFYPQGKEKPETKKIDLAPGDRVNLGNFILPIELLERVLEGYVVFPDNRPAAGVRVHLYSRLNSDPAIQVVQTDGAGRFSFPVYENVEYTLFARLDSDAGGKDTRFRGQRSVLMTEAQLLTPLQIQINPDNRR